MLATAWFWLRLLALLFGLGVFAIGLTVLKEDEQSGLKYVSCGVGVVLLEVAVTMMKL